MQPDAARLATLLERLVALDTQNPPGQEADAAALLAHELRAHGMEAAAVPVDHEGAPPRANAIGILRNGDGPVIALNSHIDTVPVGEGWSTDPLRLAARDGNLHGRGACDAKGAIAAMTEAVGLLAADRAAWRGTLVAAFVADEELTSRGSKAVAASFPPFAGVIVGEPTECQVLSAHRGAVRPLIRVHGRTAHSSKPHLGLNAIDAAAGLVGAIGAYGQRIGARTHALVGEACVSVTQIAGGFADNIIPDRCDLVLDRRLLPDESVEGVLAELRALLAEHTARSGLVCELVQVRGAAEGCETPPGAPIVQAALRAASRHGVTSGLGGLSGGCDLVHFARVGSPGIVLGPGSLDRAHKPDEFVPATDLVRAALVYRDTVLGMLATS